MIKFFNILPLLGATLVMTGVASAQNWTRTSAPVKNWNAIASSADGTKLVAVLDYVNGAYTSTNSGSTWTLQTNSTLPSMLSLASSADGTKLAGACYNSIFTSTDSGVTWTSNSLPSPNPIDVASSADGTKLVAVVGGNHETSFYGTGGPIYTSTNSGATWSVSGAPTNYWTSVASSADGTRLVAAHNNGLGSIYVSTNSGASWTMTVAPTNNWSCVASSADGLKLAAVNSFTYTFIDNNFVFTTTSSVCTSMDGGITWVINIITNAPNRPWQKITSSADGNRLAIMDQQGVVAVSGDGGANWKSNNVSAFPCWAMTSSADGNELFIAVNNTYNSGNGYIWKSQTTPSPQLHLTPSPSNFTLGWTVPSHEFRVAAKC